MDSEINLLVMNNICKSFPGVQALSNAKFQLRAGSVHALMGENGAGKSTLMKILFGLYAPDEGQIFINGVEQVIDSTGKAFDLGIAMIHQELHPIPHRSVAENIWLGRFSCRKVGLFYFINHKKMYEDTKLIFTSMQVNIHPKQKVASLSISQIQQLEIAKAISRNAKIIVMDEPTSSLTESEVVQLFALMRRLKSEGTAIIYISHKMNEILEIADEVTIMRDGKWIETKPAHELNTDLIIQKMVGRELTQRFPSRNASIGEELFRVEHFTSSETHSFRDVSFSLKKGEVLGIGGLVGAKRTELVESIYGLRSIKQGNMILHGKRVQISTPKHAKANKIALLTEDRRGQGIFPELSVFENAIIASLDIFVNIWGLLSLRKARNKVEEGVKSLQVKTPNIFNQIRNLSGGNQQKVILLRWLFTEPDIFIMDEPTRGIDVGAKYEIYSIINNLVSKGKSVIMISSELPELIGMADRIAVMSNGALAGIVDAKSTSQEEIMGLATKFLK